MRKGLRFMLARRARGIRLKVWFVSSSRCRRKIFNHNAILNAPVALLIPYNIYAPSGLHTTSVPWSVDAF